MTAQQVLDSCQQLYEKHKLITYPRSDCRYLPKEHLKQVKAVSQAVAVNEPELALAAQQADTALISRAWNDGKVDAHHAIIPTEKRMPAGRLSVAEQRLYQMIARQYLAQFYPPFCYRDTLAEVTIAGGCFVAKARVERSAGWKKLFRQHNSGDKVALTADEAGVDRDVAKLAFKDNAIDMIDAWIDSIDMELAHRLPAEKLAAMKIRDRITALLATRLEIMAPDRESLRRAMAIMAMPQNLVRSAKIGWRSADRMWRLAGDTASDFNHYTKRMTLSAVYASTLSVFVNDDSDNFADARAFLDRRIDNVMQFEKVKFQAKQRQEYVPSLSRFIGRLRYPAR